MKKIHEILRKILAGICVSLLAALVCTVTWQVFSRYVLKNPSGMSEELAKIIFVWMVLLAAAYLFGEIDGHMNIGILSDKVKGKKKIVLALLSQIAILWFVGFVLVLGGNAAVKNGMKQTNAAIPFITTGQIYMALLICGLFVVYFCAYFIYEDVKQLISKDKEGSV